MCARSGFFVAMVLFHFIRSVYLWMCLIVEYAFWKHGMPSIVNRNLCSSSCRLNKFHANLKLSLASFAYESASVLSKLPACPLTHCKFIIHVLVAISLRIFIHNSELVSFCLFPVSCFLFMVDSFFQVCITFLESMNMVIFLFWGQSRIAW